jgi:uncharacterized protein YbjT (DUF2867 family)
MILVTGGTGFIGTEIVRQLHAAGHRLRLLVRDPKSAEALARQTGAELATGDILSPTSLETAMQGVTGVVHLVGIIHEIDGATFEKVHVEGTRNVVAAAQHARVARFLHMSALGTRANARSRYHQTKFEAEEIVRASGLAWTIFRPSVVYGPGDQFLTVFDRFLRFPFHCLTFRTLPLIGGGETHLQPVPVQEAALCFTRALANPLAVGKTYDLCGPEPLTLQEILATLVEARGKTWTVDGFPYRTIARKLLWAAVLLLPLLMLLAWTFGCHCAAAWGLLVFAWVGAVLLAFRWRQTILVTVPWPLAFFLAGLAQGGAAVLNFLKPSCCRCAVTPPLTVEQVIMLQEDNIGDPRPAAKTFLYEPQPFTKGVADFISAA